VKARRVGGSTYQVPVEVSGFRATNLSLRWIIRYADQRVGRSMSIKLANEIIDTANDIGNTIKKKKKLIKWLKQIKLLHILDINFLIQFILAKSLKIKYNF
jgi:ribosomal protein S7